MSDTPLGEELLYLASLHTMIRVRNATHAAWLMGCFRIVQFELFQEVFIGFEAEFADLDNLNFQ